MGLVKDCSGCGREQSFTSGGRMGQIDKEPAKRSYSIAVPTICLETIAVPERQYFLR
jgi:hypothetical protein